MQPENSHDRPLKIAVIGDVHDQWEPADEIALKHLGVDLALFVGDFGNEAVEVVRAIAKIEIPAAVAVGNHDAWYSATPWGLKQCPYDRRQEDRVSEQLMLLREVHVGYTYRNFPALDLSVIGGRPFSWGGPDWKCEQFYQQRFGVSNFHESTTQIVAAGTQATFETLIVLSHNGPHGLGDRPEDPCGRDWHPLGGDYGDPDLEKAIAQLKAAGKKIPLVTFGHMHHHLRHTKSIQRTAVQYHDGTVYFNAAVVPRIVKTNLGRDRNFSIVSWMAGEVMAIDSVWIDQDLKLSKQQRLFEGQSPPATFSEAQ
jgi:uncharacterized protein (TIGR04168 family)